METEFKNLSNYAKINVVKFIPLMKKIIAGCDDCTIKI